jgi:helicase
VNFPEYLRFGVPNRHARILASRGVRHRTAYVQVGTALSVNNLGGNPDEILSIAKASLNQFAEPWRNALGDLVYQHTLTDLSNS